MPEQLPSLTSLFPDLEALTPDGRWSLLQDWLSKNPKYGKRAKRWSTQSADQVFGEIRNLALDEYGALAAFMLDTPAIKPRIMRAIEVLQTCYRDRKAQDQQPRAEIGDAWIIDTSPVPSAHKSINDYQAQLKAKKKRRKKA